MENDKSALTLLPEVLAMNPLRNLRAQATAHRQLLFVAAIAALALLSLYVQLLHASLERGHELREVQRTAAPMRPAKPVASAAPSPRQRTARASEPATRADASAR